MVLSNLLHSFVKFELKGTKSFNKVNNFNSIWDRKIKNSSKYHFFNGRLNLNNALTDPIPSTHYPNFVILNGKILYSILMLFNHIKQIGIFLYFIWKNTYILQIINKSTMLSSWYILNFVVNMLNQECPVFVVPTTVGIKTSKNALVFSHYSFTRRLSWYSATSLMLNFYTTFLNCPFWPQFPPLLPIKWCV